MSVVKKVNEEVVTFANKGIIDHNQLTGRNSYGAHPISAIRGLPEKITSIRENINNLNTSISLINVEADKNNPGYILFTNYLNNSSSIKSSLLPDNDIIELNSNNELTLKKIYTDFTLSGVGTNSNELTVLGLNNNGALYTASDILGTFTDQNNFITEVYQEVQAIEGRGGYLIPHDFDTTHPDQPIDNIVLDEDGEYDPNASTLSLLTRYALSQITTITSPLEIWSGTRVTNLENNHTWILNNNKEGNVRVFEWVDLGQALVSVATTDTLGVVKSSTEGYQVSVDINGIMSVNGLPELAENIVTDVVYNTNKLQKTKNNQTTDILNLSNNTTAGSESVIIGGNTLNVMTRDTTQTISGTKTFSSVDSILPETTEINDIGSSVKKWNNVYMSGNLTDGTNSIDVAGMVDKASKSIIADYTLNAVDWVNNSYTLNVTGKTVSNNALVSNSNTGTDQQVLDNAEAITDANIYKIVDNGTSLTFICENTPTVDLKIQVEVYD